MATNGSVGTGAVTPIPTVAIAPNEEALTVVQNNTESLELAINRDPAIVLAEAQKAAAALRDVISRKDKPVRFNGEQYLEFEDWQAVARFYGLTARVRSTAFVEFGEAQGFEATADVISVATGQILTSAESMCLNDERNWSNKPLFMLRSMAQTRAMAKSLRNVLSWVVVMAGYRPTPAEEMQGVAGFQQEAPIDIGDNPANSKLAAQYVAEQKLAELKKRKAANAAAANPDPNPKPWRTHNEFLLLVELLRERVGETRYNEELDLAGIESPKDFINRQDVRGALAFHNRLNLLAEAERPLQ
jgi:hypothetical protein